MNELNSRMMQSEDKQISLTDRMSARWNEWQRQRDGRVNVQSAVDTRRHRLSRMR